MLLPVDSSPPCSQRQWTGHQKTPTPTYLYFFIPITVCFHSFLKKWVKLSKNIWCSVSSWCQSLTGWVTRGLPTNFTNVSLSECMCICGQPFILSSSHLACVLLMAWGSAAIISVPSRCKHIYPTCNYIWLLLTSPAISQVKAHCSFCCCNASNGVELQSFYFEEMWTWVWRLSRFNGPLK